MPLYRQVDFQISPAIVPASIRKLTEFNFLALGAVNSAFDNPISILPILFGNLCPPSDLHGVPLMTSRRISTYMHWMARRQFALASGECGTVPLPITPHDPVICFLVVPACRIIGWIDTRRTTDQWPACHAIGEEGRSSACDKSGFVKTFGSHPSPQARNAQARSSTARSLCSRHRCRSAQPPGSSASVFREEI